MPDSSPENVASPVVENVASVIDAGESVVQIWKGFHVSHFSTKTSIGTRMFRGERNVGAAEPGLLVLTDKRILVMDLKGVFRRKYVLSESADLAKVSQVEVVGPYRTDVRIKGEWGYYSSVEFSNPIRADRSTLTESGNEDPAGVKDMIMARAQRLRSASKR